MTKKIKSTYSLILAFFIIYFFIGTNTASALELTYPTILGNSLSSSSTFPQYVVYFFNIGIILAGVLALISFTIGAVSLIVSIDNTETASNAKDRMKGSVLGLVLTLAAFIIMQTINPSIVSNSLTKPAGLSGVFLLDNSDPVQQQPCPTSENASALPTGFTKIEYICSGSKNDPDLLVWLFPKPGLEGGNSGNLNGVTIIKKACGTAGNSTVDLSSIISGTNGGSFKIAFDAPGIYYCLGGCNGDLCSGYMSDVVTSSQDTIPSPFTGNIAGIRIVKDTTNGNNYGVILHQASGAASDRTNGASSGGACSWLINGSGCRTSDDGGTPIEVIKASAADVFILNSTAGTSGTGVTFYSKPFGWDTGANAGYATIKDSDILASSPPYTTAVESSAMKFQWNNVDVPDSYKQACPYFQVKQLSTSGSTTNTTTNQCAGSIKINGSYLVVLYSVVTTASTATSGSTAGSSANSSASTSSTGYNYCQTFNQDVPNLKAQPIVAAGVASLSSVSIIPTK